MTKPTPDLLPCPFCGGSNAKPYFPVARESPKRRTFFECRDCGAFGPAGDGTKAAVAAWNRRVSPLGGTTPEPEEYSRSDMYRDGDFGPPITDEEAEMLRAAAKITPHVIRRLRANAARRQSPPGSATSAGLESFADHLESGGTVDSWPGTHTRVIDDEVS